MYTCGCCISFDFVWTRSLKSPDYCTEVSMCIAAVTSSESPLGSDVCDKCPKCGHSLQALPDK